MKVVYVGDNRHRQNFGCRATSTALSQIISKNNEIVGRIYGDYTNFNPGNLFFYQHYPKWIYRKVGSLKPNRQNLIRQLFYTKNRILKRNKYFFSNYDFISYDFDKSIENLIRLIPANPELKPYDLRQYDFDALVVNGEGSFIFATPAWRECLIEAMLMYWAEKLGKKVFFLNSMLSDDPYTPRNQKTISAVQPIFDKASAVGVREYESYNYAKENFPNAKIHLYPDALFSWYDIINDDFKVKDGKYFASVNGAEDSAFSDLDFSNKYILVSGSSSVSLASNGDMAKAINVYSNLVRNIKSSFPEHSVFLIEVCEGDHFLNEVAKNTETPIIASDTPILAAGKILANSDIFISGRYHPAILASLGGTPCVFMGSNSHKTRSVQEILHYDQIVEFDVLPNQDECNKIIRFAKEQLSHGPKLRSKIQEQCCKLAQEAVKQQELLK